MDCECHNVNIKACFFFGGRGRVQIQSSISTNYAMKFPTFGIITWSTHPESKGLASPWKTTFRILVSPLPGTCRQNHFFSLGRLSSDSLTEINRTCQQNKAKFVVIHLLFEKMTNWMYKNMAVFLYFKCLFLIRFGSVKKKPPLKFYQFGFSYD